MNNIKIRKITSLTIMTIMVAGGLTFAVPGMMPGAEAGHNQYLFVSAENDWTANTFGGAQVVEVVVRDPLNASTENGIPGAPKVEINDPCEKVANVMSQEHLSILVEALLLILPPPKQNY